jgi:thiol:disulfide interchange protein DsbC
MIKPPYFVALLAVMWVSLAQSADADKIRNELQKTVSSNIEEIKATAIPGLYSVRLDGQLVYVSKDGQYLIQGSMFELKTGKNLTTLAVLETISDKDTLMFSPKKPKHTLTVFTDTSCGYCRKLHQEVPKLNENGVKVRYLLYPRAGPDSSVAATLQSIWCADNPQEALTTAKAGGAVETKTCDNPISKHMALARQLGLRGTPMIITDTGEVIPGYQTADQLISNLNSKK